jgi:PGF-CTERM protein
MNRLLTITLAALFLAQTLAVVQAQDENNEQTIVDVASGTENHDTLVAALAHVGLDVTLNSEGPFTVFAPTDQAFTDAGVNLDDYDTDAENETLKDILLYHVISGVAVDSANVTDGMTAEAANTDTLTFTVTDGTVMVGEATVTSADVEASNGIIHVIDKILMPPADEPVDETPADDCDVTIGIGDSGLAYDKVSVTIDVGQTVCWKWTDSDMPHNVAEIAEIGSNERLAGGVYSGAAAATVDFSYTFTDNTTFYYACEPHITMGMKGEIIVGTGVDASKANEDDKESESTPGFAAIAAVVALAGAAAFLSRRE